MPGGPLLSFQKGAGHSHLPLKPAGLSLPEGSSQSPQPGTQEQNQSPPSKPFYCKNTQGLRAKSKAHCCIHHPNTERGEEEDNPVQRKREDSVWLWEELRRFRDGFQVGAGIGFPTTSKTMLGD